MVVVAAAAGTLCCCCSFGAVHGLFTSRLLLLKLVQVSRYALECV